MPYSLHVEEFGPQDGPPVLLLHGLGASGNTWTAVAERLSERYYVLVPDLLGFGQSPRPAISYTLDEHRDALQKMLDERGLGESRLVLGGHSMGCLLAVEMAARNPNRVRGAALVNFPYFRSAEEIREHAHRFGRLARLTVDGHWAAGAVCRVMCALRPLLMSVAPRLAREYPAAVVRDAFQHNFASFSGTLKNIIVDHRPDNSMAALSDLPVFLLHGDLDRTAPLENVRQALEGFPKWRLEVMVGEGHYLPIVRPEAVVSVLEGWLMGLPE